MAETPKDVLPQTPTLEIHPPDDEQVDEVDETDSVHEADQEINLDDDETPQVEEPHPESPELESQPPIVEVVEPTPPVVLLEKEQPPLPTEVEIPPTPPPHIPIQNALHISPLPTPSHGRRDSAISFSAARGNQVSVVLISSALETIAASREAKKSPQLKDSATHALEMIRAGTGGDRPREVFEPLRLACETKNEKLMVASLDCISKLISYSFFTEDVSPAQAMASASPPGSPTTATSTAVGPNAPSLAELVTHTITSAYSETTPDAVSLQIVKALLALVLSTTILVHHSALLKAVRTVYNVFLLSQDPINQMVAQGGLSQMVNHVFSRAQVSTPADTANGAETPHHDVPLDMTARLLREQVVMPVKKSSYRLSTTPTQSGSRSSVGTSTGPVNGQNHSNPSSTSLSEAPEGSVADGDAASSASNQGESTGETGDLPAVDPEETVVGDGDERPQT